MILVAILLIGAAAALLYLNRRAVAREVLVGWLDQRGVPADVEIERIELDGFVGRIRIGDPRNPDVTVERAEVDYAVALPWSKTGLGVAPSRIRLVRPVVRASWKGAGCRWDRWIRWSRNSPAARLARTSAAPWSSSRAAAAGCPPNTGPSIYWPTRGSTTAS